MRRIRDYLAGLAFVGLIFIAVSCCCTGQTDDDFSDTDLNLPGAISHDSGSGGST